MQKTDLNPNYLIKGIRDLEAAEIPLSTHLNHYHNQLI